MFLQLSKRILDLKFGLIQKITHWSATLHVTHYFFYYSSSRLLNLLEVIKKMLNIK